MKKLDIKIDLDFPFVKNVSKYLLSENIIGIRQDESIDDSIRRFNIERKRKERLKKLKNIFNVDKL